MPISSIDGCTESHWSDVLEILTEAIDYANFEANLVSHADEVGVIHKIIIQNLYDNPIVIVDVSGKNPNVMFELGMRLAFDKPTIVIKDTQTPFIFDTSSIEHLEYPRDLRFSKIKEFKDKLSSKIIATHSKAKTDPNYSTFLKHFGEFKVAKIDEREVTGQEFMLDELKSIRTSLNRLERISHRPSRSVASAKDDIDICLGSHEQKAIESLIEFAQSFEAVDRVFIYDIHDHKHLNVRLKELNKHEADSIKAKLNNFKKPKNWRQPSL